MNKALNKLKKFKQFLNEAESYTKIVEELPIKVDVKKHWMGRHYTISVPPMKMKYETFLMLGDNLDDRSIQYGKEKFNREYPKDVELYSNDVHAFQYDYSNGEATFTAGTEKDVRNWLQLYKDYVYSDFK